MVKESLPYSSYLLRLWQVDSQESSLWRCSLENAQTGDCQSFASLTAMLEFLETTIKKLESQSEDTTVFTTPPNHDGERRPPPMEH
jgi:hypothetical protein